MRYVRNRTDTATFVYRDKCDLQFDRGYWLIRDDEMRPLMVVLSTLLAADSQAQDIERGHLLAPMIELYSKQPEETKIDVEEVVALLQFIKGDS